MADTQRDRYMEILLAQVLSCEHPSPTMLDRIEQAVGDRATAQAYVSALLDGVAAERYPSPQMLDRLAGLIDALEPRPS